MQKQIIAKQTYLNELIDLVKNKLKSHNLFSSTKQERMEKLDSLFKNISPFPEEFIKGLENIKHGLSKKLTNQEFKELCQVKTELSQLQMELENLQKQQTQVQNPSK